MYQIFVGVVIFIIIIMFIRSGKRSGIGMGLIIKRIVNQWRLSANSLSTLKEEKSPVFHILSDFFMALTTILFFVLGLTGFTPVLIFGAHLTGTLLIIHVTTAPLFVISLMLTLLFRAQRNQFTVEDFNYLQRGRKNVNAEAKIELSNQFLQKLCFWLFGIFSLPAILSMVLSMYPIFGTGWQVAMLNLHQFSVLVLLIIAMIYVNTKFLQPAG